MGSKSWVVILLIGAGSVVAFGLMTKFAVDSNPGLQAVIRFKAAFAEDFESRGMKEVSLRRLPRQRGGYQLLLTATPPATGGAQAALDRDVAEYFLKHFDRRRAAVLRLSYLEPRTLSCSQGGPYREKDISLMKLRAEVADRERLERLRSALAEKPGGHLRSVEWEKRTVLVDIEVPSSLMGAPPGDPPRETVEAWAEQAQAVVRNLLRYRLLELRVHAASTGQAPDAAQPPLLEVRFDSRGRKLEPRKRSEQ